MAKLGSDNTPISGELFGLPSGWTLTENADGEAVFEDSGGNVVLRRDATNGEWVTDSINAGSADLGSIEADSGTITTDATDPDDIPRFNQIQSATTNIFYQKDKPTTGGEGDLFFSQETGPSSYKIVHSLSSDQNIYSLFTNGSYFFTTESNIIKKFSQNGQYVDSLYSPPFASALFNTFTDDGTLIRGGSGVDIAAIDSDLELIWDITLSATNIYNVRSDYVPTEDIIIVQNDNPELQGINLSDGSIAYTNSNVSGSYNSASLYSSENDLVVVFDGDTGELVTVDPADGTITNSTAFNIRDEYIFDDPYLYMRDSDLKKVDVSTLNTEWVSTSASPYYFTYGATEYGDYILFVQVDPDRIVAINKSDGSQAWTIDLEYNLYNPNVYLFDTYKDRIVLFVDGSLICYNASTKNKIERFSDMNTDNLAVMSDDGVVNYTYLNNQEVNKKQRLASFRVSDYVGDAYINDGSEWVLQ